MGALGKAMSVWGIAFPRRGARRRARAVLRARGRIPLLTSPSPVTSRETGGKPGEGDPTAKRRGMSPRALSAGTFPRRRADFYTVAGVLLRRVFQSDTLIFCGGCVIIKYQSAGRILLCGSRRISGKPVPAGQERRSRDAQ